MRITPEMSRFLGGMEYPATKDDLLREAMRDGLGPADVALLEDLPEQSYNAAWNIRYRLGSRALSDAFSAAEPALA
jgi:hypothetical protein